MWCFYSLLFPSYLCVFCIHFSFASYLKDASSLLILDVKDVPPSVDSDSFDDIDFFADAGDPAIPSDKLAPPPVFSGPLGEPPGAPKEVSKGGKAPAHRHDGALQTSGVSGAPKGPPCSAEGGMPSKQRVPCYSARLGGPSGAPKGLSGAPQKPSGSSLPSVAGEEIQIEVLGFTEAKKAFGTALKKAEVPWHFRWFAGRVGQNVKEPKDSLHAQFLAALLQVRL